MRRQKPKPRLVYADRDGRIFDHPHLLMVCDSGQGAAPPTDHLVPLPRGSDLYTLPDRRPIGLDPATGRLEVLDGPYNAVSVFLAPAWVRLAHPAYRTDKKAPVLPLYAYSPMGFHRDRFWTQAVRVDSEPRQDPWLFDTDEIGRRVAARREASPGNQLIEQLDRCAVEYGCRAAQNYFLARFEAPLPLSEGCNAACVGCISLDPVGTDPAHERILKAPGPEEIAEVACEHIAAVERAVVSFGQGCEGEPLLRADVMEEAIGLIRERTADGTIHLNSNASLPAAVERLCRAGLQSLRISMNSAVADTYSRYYRPRNFAFTDVTESGRAVTRHGGYVSLNLLVFPGINDTEPEIRALEAFIERVGVKMIQMRNLNVDPELYRSMLANKDRGRPFGLVTMMERLRERFPALRYGYFNPPHESFADDPGPILTNGGARRSHRSRRL